MSKMPAKKKSCFQITSVTQAQVAAVGAADDTESLDDPDESRTEDVSSEIYDMSRAEYEPACDRSSSEEALNAGEAEATVNASQAGLMSVGESRKVGVSGSSQGAQQVSGVGVPAASPHVTQPGVLQQQQQPVPAAGVSVNASQPAAVTCSSRFRVIKLDHGTGEPFRRGRWTCTEFYERDSEASLAGRTGDGVRHPSVALDPAADRDSGLGLTGGSAAAPATHSGLGVGSSAETSHSSIRMHPVETLPQQPQQILHQNYSAAQPPGGRSALKPVAAAQPAEPAAAQTLLTIGQNGLPQSGVHIQKSPIMAPAAHPAAYPLQHLTAQNQAEYYPHQQLASMPPGQSAPQPGSQGPPPVIAPASGGVSVPSQVGDAPGGGAVSAGQPQTVGLGGGGGSAPPQQTASQYAAGQPQSLGHPASSGVQNVPAKAVSSNAAAAVLSASSAAVPNATTPSLPPGQLTHSKVVLGMQGLPAAAFAQMEGRKAEGAANAQSPGVSAREPGKPLMPETLQLSNPTVNSLFGIHIPVDGEEDR